MHLNNQLLQRNRRHWVLLLHPFELQRAPAASDRHGLTADQELHQR
jgi:hypothetical protein